MSTVTETSKTYKALVNDVAQAMAYHIKTRDQRSQAEREERESHDALDDARSALQDYLTRDVDAVFSSLLEQEQAT